MMHISQKVILGFAIVIGGAALLVGTILYRPQVATPQVPQPPQTSTTTPSVPAPVTTSTSVMPSVVADQIHVTYPQPNDSISSPLVIKGSARGSWYFEADFPVRLEDAKGRVIARGIAQAQGEWMTENFVPFEVRLSFSSPATSGGTLILEKDNPSGLDRNAASRRIPIAFAKKKVVMASAPCFVGGCSSQICSDNQGAMSTCEYRPEYACYATAQCKRQANDSCGWTQTPSLTKCIEEARNTKLEAVY